MADKKVIRTIGVLTSGGDAPGMNAAIRAVVRTALGKGLKVRGIRRGYQGLLNEEIIDLSARDVSDTIERGGTILQTARCAEMRTEEGQQKAAAICKKYGIDGLVVIGGDTSTSHERCSIIEVMGRDAGYLALWCGIANGAEKILMPEEHDYDEEKIIEDIQESRKRGKKNYIIINAEGVGDSMNMAKRIEEATGMETRATILGHMQRGGSPTCKDRVYASIMGAKAVDLLLEGKTNRVVGYKHGEYVDFDIDEALGMHKGIPAYQYEIAKELAL